MKICSKLTSVSIANFEHVIARWETAVVIMKIPETVDNPDHLYEEFLFYDHNPLFCEFFKIMAFFSSSMLSTA